MDDRRESELAVYIDDKWCSGGYAGYDDVANGCTVKSSCGAAGHPWASHIPFGICVVRVERQNERWRRRRKEGGGRAFRSN